MNESEQAEVFAADKRQLDAYVAELNEKHNHELRVLNTRIQLLTDKVVQLEDELALERMQP